MNPKTLPLRLLAAGLACLAAACVSDAGSGPRTSAREIAAAKALWRANRPAHYAYTVRMVCECPMDSILVVAASDSVVSAVSTLRLPGGDPYAIPDPQDYSIDSLFAALEAMERSRPEKLYCRFDPHYGFPDTLSYDGNAQAVDDELDQTIFDFRVESGP